MTLAGTKKATPPQVFLHIGAMKTGTSFLQQLLHDNTKRLLRDGVLYPGGHGPRNQIWAVRDALDMVIDEQNEPRFRGRWDELVQQVEGYHGRAVLISMELMSFSPRKGARRVADSFGGSDLHVILTLRDPSRALPSAWQEWIQSQGSGSWVDFAANVLAGAPGDTPESRAYRRTLDVQRMLDTWTPLVAPGRVHVVTVPPSGSAPSMLWERFASVVGVDPDPYKLPARVNESIGYHAAELVRVANPRLVEQLDNREYINTVKWGLCKRILPTISDHSQVPLSSELYEHCQTWTSTLHELVESVGAEVVGDLADLAPDPARFTRELTPVTDADLVRVGQEALVAFEALRRYDLARLKELTTELGEDPRSPGRSEWPVADDLDPEAPGALDQVVERLTAATVLVARQRRRLEKRRMALERRQEDRRKDRLSRPHWRLLRLGARVLRRVGLRH